MYVTLAFRVWNAAFASGEVIIVAMILVSWPIRMPDYNIFLWKLYLHVSIIITDVIHMLLFLVVYM